MITRRRRPEVIGTGDRDERNRWVKRGPARQAGPTASACSAAILRFMRPCSDSKTHRARLSKRAISSSSCFNQMRLQRTRLGRQFFAVWLRHLRTQPASRPPMLPSHLRSLAIQFSVSEMARVSSCLASLENLKRGQHLAIGRDHPLEVFQPKRDCGYLLARKRQNRVLAAAIDVRQAGRVDRGNTPPSDQRHVSRTGTYTSDRRSDLACSRRRDWISDLASTSARADCASIKSIRRSSIRWFEARISAACSDPLAASSSIMSATEDMRSTICPKSWSGTSATRGPATDAMAKRQRLPLEPGTVASSLRDVAMDRQTDAGAKETHR